MVEYEYIVVRRGCRRQGRLHNGITIRRPLLNIFQKCIPALFCNNFKQIQKQIETKFPGNCDRIGNV